MCDCCHGHCHYRHWLGVSDRKKLQGHGVGPHADEVYPQEEEKKECGGTEEHPHGEVHHGEEEDKDKDNEKEKEKEEKEKEKEKEEKSREHRCRVLDDLASLSEWHHGAGQL